MNFVEKEKDEGLAEHLLRNASALGLSRDQVQRARAAYRLAQQPSAAERRDGGRLAWAVRQEVYGAADVAETVAVKRGEEVVRFNDAGARRVRDRDGLQAVAESGGITAAQLQVGTAYRYLYEHGAGYALGSQLEDRVRIPAASTDGAVAHGLLRAYAGVRLTAVDRAVSAADLSGRALMVLRAVAGEGQSLRSLGGGSSYQANARALTVALGAAVGALHGNGGLRIT
jgi:hypothetical protein